MSTVASRPPSPVRRGTRPPPRQLPSSLVVIPDSVRAMGLSLWATRGAGKSRLLGRVVAWQDLWQGTPLVLFDPLGGAIDELLDKIARQPLARRQRLWKRVRYVNMAGQSGRVTSWPVYYQAAPGERLADQAQRFIDVLLRSDPELARAPIQGRNALVPLATAVGIVCCGMGVGIRAADSLITQPGNWEGRLAGLARQVPETAGAAAELQALWRLPPREQEIKTAALRSKLSLVRLNRSAAAMYGASRAGIDWHEVVARRLAVLLDFRDLTAASAKQFALLWVYQSLLTFIKQRGHGRHTPISLIIDELSYLVGTAVLHSDLLTADLDELVNRLSRSHSVWLTLAGQELFQLPEQLRATVLSAGTLLLGQTSDEQTALLLAARYFPYDPYLVKKTEAIRGVVAPYAPRYGPWISPYGTVAVRTTEFTRDEQNYLASRRFLQLGRFEFLLGVSPGEGQLPTSLTRITTARLDAGQYPDTRLTGRLKHELTLRDGRTEEELLDEGCGVAVTHRSRVEEREGHDREAATYPSGKPPISRRSPARVAAGSAAALQ